jgi:hypothetical protein
MKNEKEKTKPQKKRVKKVKEIEETAAELIDYFGPDVFGKRLYKALKEQFKDFT